MASAALEWEGEDMGHRGPTTRHPVKEYSALLYSFLLIILFIVYACASGNQGTTSESQLSLSTL